MKNPWKMAVCSPAAYQKSPHDIYQHPLGPWHPVGAGWDEKWQLAAAEAAWGDRKKFRDEGCLEVQVIRWNWICKLETSTIEINWIPIIPIKVDVSIYKGWTWGYPSWPHSRSSHCRGLIKVLIRMPGLVESEEMECQIGCGALLAYQCLIINHSFSARIYIEFCVCPHTMPLCQGRETQSDWWTGAGHTATGTSKARTHWELTGLWAADSWTEVAPSVTMKGKGRQGPRVEQPVTSNWLPSGFVPSMHLAWIQTTDGLKWLKPSEPDLSQEVGGRDGAEESEPQHFEHIFAWKRAAEGALAHGGARFVLGRWRVAPCCTNCCVDVCWCVSVQISALVCHWHLHLAWAGDEGYCRRGTSGGVGGTQGKAGGERCEVGGERCHHQSILARARWRVILLGQNSRLVGHIIHIWNSFLIIGGYWGMGYPKCETHPFPCSLSPELPRLLILFCRSVELRNWRRARRVCWTPSRWQEWPAKLSRGNWSLFAGSGRTLRAKSGAWRRRSESLAANRKPRDTWQPGDAWSHVESQVKMYRFTWNNWATCSRGYPVIAAWNCCCRWWVENLCDR